MLRQYRQVRADHPGHPDVPARGPTKCSSTTPCRRAGAVADLTARGRGTAGEAPLCGVPYHAADGYIARLVGGYVAICDQTEDARQAKGIVRRGAAQVVSPAPSPTRRTSRARTPNSSPLVRGPGRRPAGRRAAPGGDARPRPGFGSSGARRRRRRDPRRSPRRLRPARNRACGRSRRGHGLPGERLGELSGPHPRWRFGTDTAARPDRALRHRRSRLRLRGEGAGDPPAARSSGISRTRRSDLRHVTRIGARAG